MKNLVSKRTGWLIIGNIIFVSVVGLISKSASPNLSTAARLALIGGVTISCYVWSLSSKFESIPLKLLIAFVGRFGMWLMMGYLLHSQWRWEFSLALAVILSPLDWMTIYRARERKLDKLNAQNIPPMSFRP